MQYYRIKKQKDFKRLFDQGKKAHSSRLTILYTPSKQISMAVCVSKKHGKSVVRNRIKRLLREAFRREIENLNGQYSFVLLPKVCEDYSYAEFKKCIAGSLKKAGLYKKPPKNTQ